MKSNPTFQISFDNGKTFSPLAIPNISAEDFNYDPYKDPEYIKRHKCFVCNKLCEDGYFVNVEKYPFLNTFSNDYENTFCSQECICKYFSEKYHMDVQMEQVFNKSEDL